MEELLAVTRDINERKPGDDKCEAPGQLPYHYAPLTPLVIVDGPEEIETERSAFLSFTRPSVPVKSRHIKVLSPSGDMREAASHFFSYLIELDREATEAIYAQKIPETGLGKAMMDRLRKAAAKRRFVKH
jgi:L-threonylcarbamoyladenylate synthase